MIQNNGMHLNNGNFAYDGFFRYSDASLYCKTCETLYLIYTEVTHNWGENYYLAFFSTGFLVSLKGIERLSP